MSLSSREEKLALAVFVVIALGALTVGTTRIRAWRGELWEQESEVEAREVEARELRDGGAVWEERRRWIEESLPRHVNDGEARSGLVSAVQTSAGRHSVTLQNQKLIDPEESAKPGGEEFSGNRPSGFALQVTATGDLQNLVLWWQELLQPEHFRQINFLKVIPEDDTSNELRCSVEIWQWYQLAPESTGEVLSVSP